MQSYVLPCSISLLSNEVWDRFNRVEYKLNPVVTQQIVGIDIMPIKIEGSISFPVAIGKATFDHDFIVANEITAEAI